MAALAQNGRTLRSHRRAFGDDLGNNTNQEGGGKKHKKGSIAALVANSSSATSSTDSVNASNACSATLMQDIDMNDRQNPQYVTDYVMDIYTFFRDAEVKKSADVGYMSRQSDINERMRAILIDWLVEVHLKFKLMPETLYLTVNVLDRFLAVKDVHRSRLQLVGCASMLVAAKYEEIYAPEVRDFVYISDKAFTRDDVLATESEIINTLAFNFTVPTTYHFLNRFFKAAGAEPGCKFKQAARYYAERTLQEYKFLKYRSSMIAAAACALALKATRGEATTCALGAWSPALVQHSGYADAELTQCMVRSKCEWHRINACVCVCVLFVCVCVFLVCSLHCVLYISPPSPSPIVRHHRRHPPRGEKEPQGREEEVREPPFPGRRDHSDPGHPAPVVVVVVVAATAMTAAAAIERHASIEWNAGSAVDG